MASDTTGARELREHRHLPIEHDDHHDHDHDHHGHDHDDDDGHGHHHPPFSTIDAIRIAIVAICLVLVFFQVPDAITIIFDQPDIGDLAVAIGQSAPWLSWVPDWFTGEFAIPFSYITYFGLLVGGWPLFAEAWEALKQRRMTMEASMAIAVIAATYTGNFVVALWVTMFVLIAEVLEGMTLERGRRAIRDMLELLPREVNVRRNGEIVEISSSQLRLGDAVLVAPGGRVPVDGPVVAGNSFVDEAQITGESMPVEKTAGSRAFAGTVNQSGVLEITAERIGRDTSYGQIIETVERAERSRAPVQRFADRVAGWIVYFAIFWAALNWFLFKGTVDEVISMIVVAGACGVAAGTPLAVLGGIGRAARQGAIVKGGIHLETLSKVDLVVLDKTGTLTLGKPQVTRVVPLPGVTESELLAAAATAELRSEHPLGKAVVDHVRRLATAISEPDGFEYRSGRGIAAIHRGETIVVGNRQWLGENGIEATAVGASDEPAGEILVARGGRLLGSIMVADVVRPEARQAVADLKAMGVRTLLLTGDTLGVARAVATELGIDDIEAEMLPEHKLARIRHLTAAKNTVAMIGDGINDAPALAAASVGIAMGSGTEVARQKADIVLLGNDLGSFVSAFKTARRARGIIIFNFIGTMLVDVVGLALAMMGLISIYAAAAIHTGSELFFILNSARLLPPPKFLEWLGGQGGAGTRRKHHDHDHDRAHDHDHDHGHDHGHGHGHDHKPRPIGQPATA